MRSLFTCALTAASLLFAPTLVTLRLFSSNPSLGLSSLIFLFRRAAKVVSLVFGVVDAVGYIPFELRFSMFSLSNPVAVGVIDLYTSPNGLLRTLVGVLDDLFKFVICWANDIATASMSMRVFGSMVVILLISSAVWSRMLRSLASRNRKSNVWYRIHP